jgi:hypothetical protein
MRDFSYSHLLKRTPANEGLDGLCAVHTLALVLGDIFTALLSFKEYRACSRPLVAFLPGVLLSGLVVRAPRPFMMHLQSLVMHTRS